MPNKREQINALTELNEELENYFRNTIIPQLFIDAELILKKFTPPAMKQFSLSDSDLGKPITDIVNNLRFPTIIDNIQHVVDTNEILEKEIQTTDFRWYQMNIIPYVVRKDNHVNGVIITFVEITTRIRDLRDQETLIAEYETIMDTLTHDIKTPLTSLMLAIELFRRGAVTDPEQQSHLLDRVENSIRKMKTLIHDLTDARMQEHAFKSEEELLTIEHILEDVRLTLADNLQATGACILPDIQVPEILFSRRKLRTVLYNLVSNAIKYKSPDRNPLIVVTTEQTSDGILISVRDNGRGIDPDKLDAIFLKYFRLENKLEGTGLGLYLVKEIVLSAGGTITVQSEPGIGSAFSIHFRNR